MIENSCAICGPGIHFKILYAQNFGLKNVDSELFSARKRPKGLHYQVVQCRQCGLVFSNPIFSQSALENIYRESSFSYEEDLESAKETYQKILKRVCRRLPQKEAFLEIGCSNGFTLESARELGFREIYGIEPNQEEVKHANETVRNFIQGGILKEGLYPEKKFDLICAFHVFDHLSDPNEFLTLCRHYLKEDGYLLFIHHNVKAFPAKLLRDRCPIIDVVHPYLYDKTTQRKILEKNHFYKIKFFNVYDCYSLNYWMKLFPLSERWKEIFLQFLRALKIERFKIKLPVGNMGVFAQK